MTVRDYLAEDGRSLESLGLGHLSAAALKSYLATGAAAQARR